eukprot:Seg2467.4 transcript_id=Seg2467.4/GoldUCD/mRNA.D3Y31 product="hypothetical protein" protein_id=Seg2467.4/GoldUCD/D3Y31
MSSTRRKRDSVRESESEGERISERRKVGKAREIERDLSERKNSSVRKKRDSSNPSDCDGNYKEVREIVDRRKTGRSRDSDAKRAAFSRKMRDSSSESGVNAKGMKSIVGSFQEGAMSSSRRETRRRKMDEGNSSDNEERERKEGRTRSGHKKDGVEAKEDRKNPMSVKDVFKSRGDTRSSQREDVDVSESASKGFKERKVENADYEGWKVGREVSNEQNHGDHDTAYASENAKNVVEKGEGVSSPWKPLESNTMEKRDVVGNENDEHHAMDSMPDNMGFSIVAKVDAGEIPNTQTGKDETKAERVEVQEEREHASSSDFSLYGDIDLEDIRKQSKLEKITKGAGDSGHRNSRRKNRRRKETPSDTDSDHEKRRGHRKGRRHKESLSDSDDSSDSEKGRSHRKDRRHRATLSDSGSESLAARKSRKRSRSPKQSQRQRTKDGSSSTERRKTVVRKEDRTGYRTKEVNRKAGRHSKKYSSDSESDDQKKRGQSVANKDYKSRGRQISSSDESDRYASRAKRPRKAKATRRSSSFSSWSSSSESDERRTKDTKKRGKHPSKREEQRSEDTKTRFRWTDSDDSRR